MLMPDSGFDFDSGLTDVNVIGINNGVDYGYIGIRGEEG